VLASGTQTRSSVPFRGTRAPGDSPSRARMQRHARISSATEISRTRASSLLGPRKSDCTRRDCIDLTSIVSGRTGVGPCVYRMYARGLRRATCRGTRGQADTRGTRSLPRITRWMRRVSTLALPRVAWADGCSLYVASRRCNVFISLPRSLSTGPIAR